MQSGFFFSSASKILVHRIGIVRSRSVNEHCRCLLTYLPVVAHATGERKGIAKQTNRWKATFWFRKYIHYMTAYIYEGLNCILPLIYHTEILPYLHAKCIQETRLKLLPIWGEIGKWIFTACPWIKKIGMLKNYASSHREIITRRISQELKDSSIKTIIIIIMSN